MPPLPTGIAALLCVLAYRHSLLPSIVSRQRGTCAAPRRLRLRTAVVTQRRVDAWACAAAPSRRRGFVPLAQGTERST
jgi:hypothetical protein